MKSTIRADYKWKRKMNEKSAARVRSSARVRALTSGSLNTSFGTSAPVFPSGAP